MVCVFPEFLGCQSDQPLLDLQRRLALREAGAIGDAEDVGIDGNRGFAERGVENDVGRLASDAGQLLECLARPWNFAAVLVQE